MPRLQKGKRDFMPCLPSKNQPPRHAVSQRSPHCGQLSRPCSQKSLVDAEIPRRKAVGQTLGGTYKRKGMEKIGNGRLAYRSRSVVKKENKKQRLKSSGAYRQRIIRQ